MRSTLTTTATVAAGLALVGGLVGCAAASAPDPDAVDPAPPSTGTDSGTDTGTATGGTYADGTYSATGQYQSPGGTRTVEVTVTLADDIITDVTVVGTATDAESKIYQGEFVGGIASVVEGKDIDSLQVDRVGGSSLTSGGFNAAIAAIKAEAAQ